MDDKTFFSFYAERINRVVSKLQNGYQSINFWQESVWRGIGIDLYEVFHRAAVRCLIAELHVCKKAGILSGQTVREEYDSYCRLLAEENYVKSIYQKYPGLLQYLQRLEKIQFCFWDELLERLTNDWEEIKKYFHLDTESCVLSVRRSGSDFHCEAKSVVIIETNQQKNFI